MTGSTNRSRRDTAVSFPDAIGDGATVLVVVDTNPTAYALGLRALCQYGGADDSALVVTTTESADRTAAVYDDIRSNDCPSICLVDTVSEQQNVTALYDDPPTVFTPSAADIERIVIALSELTEEKTPATSRHLVLRSLTPLLEHSSTNRVCNLLQRISGLRTGTGIGYIGLEYSEHDEGTIAAVAQHVNGILWVTEDSNCTLDFEFQLARRYTARSNTSSQ